MKFSCTKENVSRMLTLVSGLTGKNVTLPILNNILIRAEEQRVEIAATNLELAIIINVRAKVDAPGSFTVPARTLSEFIGLLPNERIDFELVGGELALHCGKTATKIKGTSAEEFPVLPATGEGKGQLVGARELVMALSRVLPAVAKNEIRPELAGVFFGFNTAGPKTLTLAATDSYRLAEQTIPLEQTGEAVKIVVPGRTAQELARALGAAEEGEKSVRLLIGENQLVVNYDSFQIVSRLVAGQYPDYTQIIPSQFHTTITVATEALAKEIKAAGLFTTSGVNAVALSAQKDSNTLAITAVSQQTGEYASEMAAEMQGENVSVVLNHRYILDGLAHIATAETKLQMVDSESPCLLTPAEGSGQVYVIMPIRQ